MVPISATLETSSLRRDPVLEAPSIGNLYEYSEIGIKSPGG